MYLMTFDRFNQYFNRFTQYLVMYLVPGVKGLPGGADLVCHADLDPGYYYGMQRLQHG